MHSKRTLHIGLLAILTLGLLLLAGPGTMQAAPPPPVMVDGGAGPLTAPISGQTIEFAAAGVDVGASTAHVYGVATGDLDNDGDLDIVTTSHSGEDFEIIAWQNDGTPFSGGTWTPNDVGASADLVRTVALGDLDNDGWLDIVVGTNAPAENYEVIAWQNDGTPFTGLWTQNDVGSPGNRNAFSVALADLDNDGDLDIVNGNQDGAFEIYVWENNGTPFTGLWTGNGVVSLGGTYSAWDVTVGDLDNDGYIDIISQDNTAAGVAVYQNDGTPFTGTWTRNAVGSISSNVAATEVGDVDNDGDLDIVYGRHIDVSVYENDGTPFAGTWTVNTVGTVIAQTYAVRFADLDNDGDLDIAAGTASGEDFEVIAWQNDGSPFSGAWAQRDVGASADTVNGIALGDLDNDGDLDIISGSGSAEDFEIIAWQNDIVHRNAPYADSGQSLGSSSSLHVAMGDVDGDGDLDAFVANGASAANHPNMVWLNDGAGGFTDSGQSLGNRSSGAVALGDVDGDGDLDAFVANGLLATGQGNKVWLNDGSGSFSDSGQSLGSLKSRGVTLGDMDGDGDLDAFVTNLGNPHRVWWNNGSGVFSSSSSVGANHGRDVALGDVDGDGDLDAFVARESNQPNRVFVNNGSGTFTDSGQSLGNSNSWGVELGDVDGDGDLDAFVANPSGASSSANKVYVNNGSGTFSDSGQNLGSSTSRDVALRDVDGDGDLDAFVANLSSQANKVWLNDSSGSFSDSGQNLGSSSSTGAALGDLDGDGDLDAFVGNSGQGDRMWRNEGGSAGLAPTDTAPAGMYETFEDDVMEVAFAHNGIAGDRTLELNRWDLDLLRADCSTPLTSAEANAIIDNLRVRLDDGDGVFETDGSDVLVADVGVLVLTAGVQPVAFSDGDANVQVATGGSASFWISALATSNGSSQTPNSFCLGFDPDADALVEGKTPDFSVSIQDTGLTQAGPVTILSVIPVNTCDDELNSDGDCSLREAIQAANTDAAVDACPAGSGADTIVLPACTYNLSIAGAGEDNNATGDLDILDDLTILGAGARSTIIDANTIDRVMDVPWTGVHHTVVLNDLTLQGGVVTGIAGGLNLVNSTVTLNRCTVQNNTATQNGGGIHNAGGLGTLTVSHSTIADNTAGNVAGGIASWQGGATNLVVLNSTVSGNTANVDGGGIYSGNAGEDETWITNSTITDNEADADHNGTGAGGGIRAGASATTVSNTIVVGNLDNGSADPAAEDPDCVGTVASQDYNVFGDNVDCPSAANDQHLNVFGLTPADVLDPLADNGGDTDTHALVGGSPALDDIPNATNGCGTTIVDDQRGEPRPYPAGGSCDVGSYEQGYVFNLLDVFPDENSHDATLDTNVVVTVSGALSTTSVTTQSLFVHGGFHGHVDGVISFSGGDTVVTYNPDNNFYPGELVQTSVTTDVLDVGGSPLSSPYVWQFRTAAGVGPGFFVNNGQSLSSGFTTGIALGDLDGDGDLDAFTADDGPNEVYINDGNGTFTDSGQSLGSQYSLRVDLGDVDGDGDLDAYVGNYCTADRVWLNDGSGTFTTSGQALSLGCNWRPALGDVDGDGDLDAFVATQGANTVWLNDGSGAYTDSGQSLGSSQSYGVSLGDLDGDGDLDAFVGNVSAPGKVWLNDGSGTFTDSGQNLAVNGGQMDIGDVDGDGDLDAAMGSSIWLNDGSATFTDSGQTLSSSPRVVLGDVDGDGDLDLYAVTSGDDQVWLNDGSGTYTNSGNNLGNPNGRGAALGDLDGDGDLDAFAVRGIYVILLNSVLVTDVTPDEGSHDAATTANVIVTANGPLSTTTVTTQSLVIHGGFHGWMDGAISFSGGDTIVTYNPDDNFYVGELVQTTVTSDVLAVGGLALENTPYVWQFRTRVLNGPGLFVDTGQALRSDATYGLKLGDLDGDGDLDAFAANHSGQPNRVFVNDGNSNFSDSGQALGVGYSAGVDLGDVDGDGDLDAFVAGGHWSNPPDESCKVWLNDGSANFTNSGQSLGNAETQGVTLGDLDGDGDLDAVVANYRGDVSKVWFNDGSGTFTDSGQSLVTDSYIGALGDLDKDGDLDIFMATNTVNRVYFNDGSGTFVNSGQALGNNRSYDAELGDVDGDGDLDAFVANTGGVGDRIWLNDGSGTFTDSGQALSAPSVSTDVGLGDVDGDGDLDAYVANTSGLDHVYFNDGSGTFTDSGQALGTSSAWSLGIGDLDGDGDVDAYIAVSGPDRVWLNTYVYGVTVEPPTDAQSGDPGTDVVYTLWVTNTGNTTDTFDLSDTSTWAIAYPATVGPLGAGEGTTINVTVTVPAGALCTDDDTATVTATSQGDVSESDSSDLTTTANAVYAFSLTPPADAASGDPGTVVGYTLQVNNTGNCADTFDMSDVSVWAIAYPASVGPVDPGNSANVSVDVTVPAGASCGDSDTATVTATSQGDASTDSSDLTTTANTIYGVTVDPPTDAQSGDPGADINYTLRVTNTGNCADTFGLSLAGNTWPTTVPATVGPLAAGVGADVVVSVTVPACTAGGASDVVTVTATSQADSSASDDSVLTTMANNVAPVATDNEYTTPEDTFLTGGNVITDDTGDGVDSDLNCDPLTATLVTDVAVGTLNLNPDGSFGYTPALDWFGTVTFTYVLSDGNMVSVSTGHYGPTAFDIFGGGDSYNLELGDLDGDGDLDVIYTQNGGVQQVWLNQGGAQGGTPGDFGAAAFDTFGNGWGVDVALGDLDGDGDLDAAVAFAGGDPEQIWLNQGGAQGGTPGNFSAGGLFDSFGAGSTWDIDLADLDGDSDLDVIVANRNNGPQQVWLNQGGAQGGTPGNFSAGGVFDSFGAGNTYDLELGDVDGDLDLDAVLADNGAAQEVWLNQGGAQGGTPGNFSAGGVFDAFGAGNSLDVDLSDFDGDNDLDAIIVNGSGQAQEVWLNQGGAQGGTAGDFGVAPFDVFGAGNTTNIALGDVDGDGDLDAVIASTAAQEVWLNQGGAQGGTPGDFGLGAHDIFGGGNSRDVDMWDPDGDGDPDVIISNNGAQEVWLNQSILVNVTSNVATVTITVTPVCDYGLTLEPPTDAASGDPGSDVIYTLTLTNTGDCSDTFDLSDVSAWAISYPATVGPLAAGASTSFQVTVTVPAGALCGDDDTATVTLTSQNDGSQTDASDLTTTANAVYAFSLTPPADADSGDPGTVVGYTLQVNNTGNCADTFDLSDSSVWAIAYPASVGPIDPGNSANVNVDVTVPAGASCGDSDTATITATSQADSSTDASDLTTTANAVYGLDLDPAADAASGDPGTDVVYTLSVTNTGNCGDTFTVGTVSGWAIDAPASVGPLAEGASTSFQVTVTVPAGALCGDDDTATVTLTSQNDGSQTDASDLTTTANAVYAFSLTPPADAASGDPGAVVGYTLQVNNTGNCADTFDLSDVSVWAIAYPASVGPIDPGNSANVNVDVTVPAGASCGDSDTATVTATSQGDSSTDSSDLTTTANAVSGLDLDPASDAAAGDPGTDVVYTLSVTNTGNCTDTFTVGTVSGWAIDAPATVGPLAEGASTSFAVTVTVPAGAQCADNDTATVTLTSQGDGTTSDSSNLTSVANAVGGADLDPASDTQPGDPGTNVVYTLWLTNTGNCLDTFDLSDVSVWTTVYPATVGPLAAGASTSFQVTVSIPVDAGCDDSDAATVTASSLVDGASDASILNTTVNANRGLDLDPAADSQSGDPGTDVVYSLSVTNTGNCTDTFSVAAVSGWTIDAPASVGPLGIGDSASFAVTITIPAGALCTDSDNATVTLTSQGDGTTSDATALATGVNAMYGFSITPPADADSGDPGTVVGYTLQVNNTGNCADTFDLSDVSVWAIAYPASVGPIDPGNSANVNVDVTVPAGASCGDSDTATVTATSQGDSSTDSSDLTTTANAVSGLDLDPTSDAASGDPGADVVYTLSVTNTGNCTDTFTVGTVSGWAIDAPASVGPLAEGASTSFQVTVTVPAGAHCGDDDSATVTLTSQGDGSTSDASDLTTTANAVGGADLDPASDTQPGDPGADVVYTLSVTNTGNCPDTFDLSDVSVWPTVYPATVGPLDAGASTSFQVTVTIPVDAGCDDSDAATLTATSQNDGATDASILDTTVNANRGLDLDPAADAASADPGVDVVYTLSVTNTGNCTDTFGLSDLSLWPIAYQASVGPLGIGDSATLDVTVTVPLGTTGGDSDTATVTLTSQGDGSTADSADLTTSANQVAPVLDAIGDQAGDELTLIAFSATANDDNNDTLAFSLGMGAPAGTAIDPVSGAFTWTPAEDQGPGQYPLTVIVSDDGTPVLSDSETLTITVYEVNVAPVLDAIGDQAIDELALLTFTASASDADIPSNTLSFSLGAGAPAGTAIDPVSGAFSWTPSEAQGPGQYPLTVVVSDDGIPVLSDSETLTITVYEVNTAPVLNAIGDQFIDELTLLTFTASASDADIPANTLTFSLGAGAPAGTAIDPVTGLFTWTPSEAQGPGQYPLTVIVTDDGIPVLSDSETLTITVYEVNVAPVLDAIGDQTVDELALLTFTASASDADIPSNTLSFSLGAGAPAGTAIDPVSGAFTWTPAEAQGPGQYPLTVVVSDDGVPVLSDSEMLTITVYEVNVAPVAVDDVYGTDEDVTLVVAAPGVLDNDIDPDLPPNTLSAVLDSVPFLGELVLSADGSFVYTPTLDWSGTVTWTYTVSDGLAVSNVALVTISVTAVNDAPVAVDDSYTTTEDTVLVVPTATGVLANDTDVEGDPLSAALDLPPANGSVMLNADGSFVYTPSLDFNGLDTFTYIVSDGDLTDTATVAISVGAVCDYGLLLEPPVAGQSGDAGTTVTYTLHLSNTGECTDSFDLSVAALWPTDAPTEVGPLAAGAGIDILVTVDIPLEAGCSDSDLATLTATSQGDGSQSAASELDTMVDSFFDVWVEVPEDSQSGDVGTSVTYTLQLTNTGNCTDTLDVSLSAVWPTDAPTQVGPLAAGAGVNVPVVVGIPLDALEGEFDVATLGFASQGNPSVTAEVVLTTTAVVSCDLVDITGVDTVVAGCTVGFTPDSVGEQPITWLWAFGDGVTSTEEMPTHGYGDSGTYTVTVEAWNCGGSGYDSYVFTVTVDCAVTPTADLAVQKSFEHGGTVITFTVVARNLGPDAAFGAVITDTMPPELSDVSWSCVAAGGASCTISGTGDIDDSVNLPNGGVVTYTIVGEISFLGNAYNSVRIIPPVGVEDPDLSNNFAGIFTGYRVLLPLLFNGYDF